MLAGPGTVPIIDLSEMFCGEERWLPDFISKLKKVKSLSVPEKAYYLRRLTVQELMAFQTVPRDYILRGAITSKIRLIGNAFPTEVAYRITSMVRDTLRSKTCKI